MLELMRDMIRKGHGPRRKRMDRASRLESAKATGWVRAYTGKNVIRGYCKWYGVDVLCAVIELRQLGVTISEAREEELRRSTVSRSTARRKERVEKHTEAWCDSDDTYAYIAGYTPAGFAYGVTWEEMERITFEEDEEGTNLSTAEAV